MCFSLFDGVVIRCALVMRVSMSCVGWCCLCLTVVMSCFSLLLSFVDCWLFASVVSVLLLVVEFVWCSVGSSVRLPLRHHLLLLVVGVRRRLHLVLQYVVVCCCALCVVFVVFCLC